MTYAGLIRRFSVGLSAAAMLAALATPSEADACSPAECGDSPRLVDFSITHAEVATDGVLVFTAEHGTADLATPQDTLAAIELQVMNGEDALEGSLEAVDGLYVWRPAQALPAGASLSISAVIDNDALDPDRECGIADAGPFEVAVGDEALPELALPELTFATEFSLSRQLTLDSLVCCDDAYPEHSLGSCSDEPYWSEGHCAATRGTGFASASFSAADLDPAIAASLRAEIVVGEEVLLSQHGSALIEGIGLARAEAFDAQLRLISLIDGSEVSSEAFTADGGEPEQLGELDLDVAAELEEMCAEPAYTCAPNVDQEAWDPEACEPWDDDGDTDGPDSDTDGPDSDTDLPGDDSDTDGDPGQDGDGGGGCNVAAGGSGSGWLFLFGLGLAPLLRRRRR